MEDLRRDSLFGLLPSSLEPVIVTQHNFGDAATTLL